jgi:hypothetical protein
MASKSSTTFGLPRLSVPTAHRQERNLTWRIIKCMIGQARAGKALCQEGLAHLTRWTPTFRDRTICDHLVTDI